jgi:hypothetical protein
MGRRGKHRAVMKTDIQNIGPSPHNCDLIFSGNILESRSRPEQSGSPCFFTALKTNVYIDGFNFYYGCLHPKR